MKLLEEKNELEQQKKYLEDVAAQREQKIKALQSELDTVRSYKSLSADTNTVLKLETMEYEKEGYIVKEEFVRDTEFGRDIKQDSKWNFMKDDKGEQKILYIKKFHEKAIIGIDIAKIRFCRHDGYIYLEGVKVENLHQEMTIRSGDGDGMERCMILNVDNGDIKGINNAEKYNWFKQEYSIRQSDLLDFNFNQEVRSICASYTDVIKHNLSTKFPSVRFVDDKIEHAIDLAGEPIYQLNASNDLNILEVSSSIVLIANTIHQTMPAVAKF
jgi:DNA gyrase/topoisomerase IV subunit A